MLVSVVEGICIYIYMYIKTISYKELACMGIDPSRDIAVHFAMKWVVMLKNMYLRRTPTNPYTYIR